MTQTPQFKEGGKFARRRHVLQALVLLLFLVAPHPVSIVGLEHGLLSFDFGDRRIYFFGLVLVPGLFHIFFLGLMLPLFALCVSASFYSKVFCGWVCPQNIFFELFDGVARALKKRSPRFRRSLKAQKFLDLTLAVGWGLAIAWTTTCYFVEADPIFYAAAFTAIFLFFVFDTHYLKHKFCKSACPYALIQKSFQDPHSLHVVWEKREGSPCGTCHACEKACYVDLDIKKTPFDIDCTMCGACVDACSHVYSRKEEGPVLTFGSIPGRSPQKIIVGCSFVLFLALFAWAIWSRPIATFRIDYPPSGTQFEPFIVDGRETNRYRMRIRNMTDATLTYQLQVNEGYEHSGPKTLKVPPFESLSLPFTVERAPQRNIGEVSFSCVDEEGRSVTPTRTLYFRPVGL